MGKSSDGIKKINNVEKNVVMMIVTNDVILHVMLHKPVATLHKDVN